MGWAGRGFTRKLANWTLSNSAEAVEECNLALVFQPFADGPKFAPAESIGKVMSWQE